MNNFMERVEKNVRALFDEEIVITYRYDCNTRSDLMTIYLEHYWIKIYITAYDQQEVSRIVDKIVEYIEP